MSENGLFSQLPSSQPEPHHHIASYLRFSGVVLVVVAIFTALMVVMGVHTEAFQSHPISRKVADSTRERLAVEAQRIKQISQTADKSASPDPHGAELTTAAAQWAQILSPTRNNVSSPTASPSPDTHSISDSSQKLLPKLLRFSRQAVVLSDSLSEDERPTALAIALQARLQAFNLASATHGDTSSICAGPPPRLLQKVEPQTDLLRSLDTTRQWLQTDAARLPASNRSADLQRIATFTDLAEQILQNTTTDERDAYTPYPALQKGESLSGHALNTFASELFRHSTGFSPTEKNDLLKWTCSLYTHESERAEAQLLTSSAPQK